MTIQVPIACAILPEMLMMALMLMAKTVDTDGLVIASVAVCNRGDHAVLIVEPAR